MAQRCVGAAVLVAAVAMLAMVAEARQLQQTCPIWKCATGRCSLEENDAGVRVWTCSACSPTYRLLNKNACICAPGFVEEGTGTASRCVQCAKGSYCRGGNGNGDSGLSVSTNSTNEDTREDGLLDGARSYMISCGNPTAITTSVRGSTAEAACVTVAGYTYAPGGGIACPVNTYNPGANRIPACYKCPSGLITNSTASTAKRNCIVPAGWTVSRGTATPCPRGSYRVGDVAATSSIACSRCPRGWTTSGTGSRLATDCNVLQPGFKAADSTVYGTTLAIVCELGTYATGGGSATTCLSCGGYTTRATGAKSASECVAPPGYFLDNGTLAQCASGSYAAGWGRRTNCSLCGTAIQSAANTPDERPGAATNATVRGSALDCFIEAGWGMVYNRASNSYRAAICAANTYGVATTEYGLKSTPCTPCPRGLVTATNGSTNDTACYNPAGWGVFGQTAEICGPGFWATEATRMPCTRCPPNRNTTAGTNLTTFFMDTVLPAGNGAAQDDIADCKVMAGYGIVGTLLGNETDAQKANWDTLECPIGSWSNGGGLTTACTPCQGKRSTQSTGSTVVEDCDVCLPGFGLGNAVENNTNCAGCAAGFYNDGSSDNCTVCATSSFSFPGKNDAVSGIPATSKPGNGTETAGAAAADQCYPEYFQMDDSQGTHLVDTNGLTATGAANTGACASSCEAADCVASTWVYTNADPAVNGGQCFQVNSTGSDVFAVKILPLDTLVGQTAGAAAATGSYVVWGGTWNATTALGAALSELPASNAQACKDACDAASACVAVYFSASTCYLRKGLEAQATRTFLNVVGSRIDNGF